MPNLILFYFLFIILLSIYSALIKYKKYEFADWPHKEKRPEKIKFYNFIINYILVIAIFIAMFYLDKGSIYEIGIKLEIDPFICFLTGFSLNISFQLLHGKIFHKFAIFKSTIHNYRTYRSILPRKNRDKKILIISLVLLNPIYEEFLFRGILVYKLGLLIDNFYITIILGYIVFITLHLYQGISVIFTHTLHYILFILILFSPLGLIGVIGFHFGSDLFPFLTIRQTINEYVKKYRNSKKKLA
jgi:membrane protease YdiL (CAAX protease family)